MSTPSAHRVKVVLIENNTATHREVLNFLRIGAVERATDEFQLVHLPTAEDAIREITEAPERLAEAAAVLLDIYLGSAEPLDDPHGYVILPLIRKHLPWLPVIAFTSHCDQGVRTYEMSKQGFDAIVPKAVFFRNLIGKEGFLELIERVRAVRARAARNDLWHSADAEPIRAEEQALDVDRASSGFVAANPAFNQLMLDVFPNCRSLRIHSLTPGHSGATVFKVTAQQRNHDIAHSAEWVLKVSESPIKLATEIRAQNTLQLRGVHHSIFPPLLYPGLLCRDGLAAIGYQCEPESKTLALAISGDEPQPLDYTAESLGYCLKQLYGRTSPAHTYPRSQWFDERACSRGRRGIDAQAATHRGDVSLQGAVAEIRQLVDAAEDASLDGANHWLLDREIETDMRFIHGDLHADNILTMTRGLVLIDFANSGPGPAVNDLAKLETDLIARVLPAKPLAGVRRRGLWSDDLTLNESLLDDRSPDQVRRCSRVLTFCRDLRTTCFHLAGAGAVAQFRIAVLHFSIQYLDLPDISADAKALTLWRCITVIDALKQEYAD